MVNPVLLLQSRNFFLILTSLWHFIFEFFRVNQRPIITISGKTSMVKLCLQYNKKILDLQGLIIFMKKQG